MPRSIRDAVAREHRGSRHTVRRGTPATPPPSQLSPTKKRIAEALAALLVAHYRREEKERQRERIPLG